MHYPPGLCAFLRCFLLVLTAGIHPSAIANDNGSENIGFMKSHTVELTARFPMCEKFLDVKWLDKKYMVGYATYDVFVRKRPTDVAVRKRVHAIVAIPFGVPRRYDYDAYQFVRQGKLNELFDRIREGGSEGGSLSAGFAFSIGEGDTRIDLHPGGALSYGEMHPLLSDHQSTVCIAYPSGNKAWITEGRTVEKTFSGDQIDQHVENLRKEGIKTPLEFFRQMWALDFNGDGTVDFFKPRNLIYSKGSNWHQVAENFSRHNFVYQAPDSKKSCRVDSNRMNFDLTTDGKSYFAAGCNWTELSSMK